MIYPAQKTLVGILLLAVIALYFFRLQSVSKLEIPEDAVITLRGKVTQQPYLKGSYQIIYLGPISIKTGRFPGYFYGQELKVIGKFQKRVINKFQTQYVSYFPDIQVVERKERESEGFNLVATLLKTRGRIERVIGGLLPEPQSNLLLGVLFGAKRQMPQEFWQNLRETGTLHIVVASGYNISVVAGFLISALTCFISRKKALIFALLGIVFYTLMVGAEPPAVRAAIMITLAFTAQALGRQEDGLIALFVAAAIMLLISPLMLFDIGFQLSFAATTGILWIYPLLTGSKKGKIIFKIPVLGEGLATTLSAQLGVMPILLTNFGQISFLSPLINALVLWVVPIVMVFGSLVAVFGLIINPIALVLSWFVWLFLTYFVKLINLAGNLPWISLELGKLSFWWAIGYYLVLVYFVWRGYRNGNRFS